MKFMFDSHSGNIWQYLQTVQRWTAPHFEIL